MESDWIYVDFNGMLGPDLVCLSHEDTIKTHSGDVIELKSGMIVTAYDEDADDNGNPDNLFATGVVEPSPDFARCRGSKWVLQINADGFRHESEMKERLNHEVDGIACCVRKPSLLTLAE